MKTCGTVKDNSIKEKSESVRTEALVKNVPPNANTKHYENMSVAERSVELRNPDVSRVLTNSVFLPQKCPIAADR